jgi:hypothetical protein
MKDLHFDHTSRTIPQALGICEERSDELEGYINFYMVEQCIMREKLFGDDAEHDDVPANYRTKSAILERCLDIAQDEEERIFITWEFVKLDIKTDMPVIGAGLMAALEKKATKFGLDAERFVAWFVHMKAKAKADNDRDDD